MIGPCTVVGPHLPAGETEWRCTAHGVDAVALGSAPTRREDFYCPVAAGERCAECKAPIAYTKTSPLPPGMGVLHGDCYDLRKREGRL